MARPIDNSGSSLSRLNDRLAAINAQYDLIFRDDMRFRENW